MEITIEIDTIDIKEKGVYTCDFIVDVVYIKQKGDARAVDDYDDDTIDFAIERRILIDRYDDKGEKISRKLITDETYNKHEYEIHEFIQDYIKECCSYT